MLERVVQAFLVTASVYTIAITLIGEPLLTRLDAWLAAILLTAPSTIIAALPVTPVAIAGGIWLNSAAGMLAQATIGYGGCEVAEISTLLLATGVHRLQRCRCISSQRFDCVWDAVGSDAQPLTGTIAALGVASSAAWAI